MAVDDDPQVLVALRNLLEPWGLKLTLDDPQRLGNPGRIHTDLLVLTLKCLS